MISTLRASTESRADRFVTIAFDDGLLEGAKRAVALLDQLASKATFYLVTGWVRPNRVRIRDPWNAGRDHGSWLDWQQIDARGHEIGSHTVSHIKVTERKARLLPGRLRWELQSSYNDLQRHLQKPPVSIAMPFDASTPASERLVKRIYQAALVGHQPLYNNLAEVNWYRLASWAPNPEVPVPHICEKIAGIPPGHWLILKFHSLDDEGWMPISAAKLEAIVRFIAQSDNLRQVTVRDMVEMYKNVHASDLQREESRC